jgi:hypothetical protein
MEENVEAVVVPSSSHVLLLPRIEDDMIVGGNHKGSTRALLRLPLLEPSKRRAAVGDELSSCMVG